MEDIKIIKKLSNCKKTNLLLNYFYGEFVDCESDFKSGINENVLYCINSLGTRYEQNIYSSGSTSIISFDDIKELLKKCNYCNVDKMSCEKLHQIMINASSWASMLYRSDIYTKFNFKSNIDYEIYIKQFKNY